MKIKITKVTGLNWLKFHDGTLPDHKTFKRFQYLAPQLHLYLQHRGFSSVTPCESRCWYVGQDRACQWLSLKGKIELEWVCLGASLNMLQDPVSVAYTAPVSMILCFTLYSWIGSLSNTRVVGGTDGWHIQTRYRWGGRWRGAAIPTRCLCFSQNWQVVQKLCSGNNYHTRPMFWIVSVCGVEEKQS